MINYKTKDKAITWYQKLIIRIEYYLRQRKEVKQRKKINAAIAFIVENATDSGYIKHAKCEFKIAFNTIWKADKEDEEDIEMQKFMCEQVLELLAVLSTHGDTGTTIGYKLDLFNKLVKFETIAPLTLEDDEFYSYTDVIQNKRNSAIFKEKDGSISYLYGLSKNRHWYIGEDNKIIKDRASYTTSGSVFVVKPDGSTYSIRTSVLLKNKKADNLKTFVIPIYEIEYPMGWWISLVKEEELNAVKKVYDVIIDNFSLEEELDYENGIHKKEIQARIEKVKNHMYPKTNNK